MKLYDISVISKGYLYHTAGSSWAINFDET